jgi:hypothetical protein
MKRGGLTGQGEGAGSTSTFSRRVLVQGLEAVRRRKGDVTDTQKTPEAASCSVETITAHQAGTKMARSASCCFRLLASVPILWPRPRPHLSSPAFE